MIFKPPSLVAPSWNCANHNIQKRYLNWPCVPQNSLNLSPKSSLKWKISGNEYKSPHNPPWLYSSLLFCNRSARSHTYFVATQLYLTPRAPLPVCPPHPGSPERLFTQCAVSQTAVGQKHPVSRENDRREANFPLWITAWWYSTLSFKAYIDFFPTPGYLLLITSGWCRGLLLGYQLCLWAI